MEHIFFIRYLEIRASRRFCSINPSLSALRWKVSYIFCTFLWIYTLKKFTWQFATYKNVVFIRCRFHSLRIFIIFSMSCSYKDAMKYCMTQKELTACYLWAMSWSSFSTSHFMSSFLSSTSSHNNWWNKKKLKNA